jgi:hypothetical protein
MVRKLHPSQARRGSGMEELRIVVFPTIRFTGQLRQPYVAVAVPVASGHGAPLASRLRLRVLRLLPAFNLDCRIRVGRLSCTQGVDGK